jgi:hypothetical protein
MEEELKNKLYKIHNDIQFIVLMTILMSIANLIFAIVIVSYIK